MLTEMERAYIAGFFDGEGCVASYSRAGSNGHANVVIRIAQKTPMILEKIQQQLGYGSVRPNDVRGYTNWVYVVSSKDNVLNFIDTILPYSIVKKKQLEVAKSLVSMVGLRGKALGEEGKAERFALYTELRELKKEPYVTR